MAEDRAVTFLRMIRRSHRGRLKVYLGYCAGVGKTYQMLLEGHRLKTDGIDVVVGLVETHGREETAKLLDGLETVPRLRLEYRGVALEEMDVEAVIARKPEVALIDELAHTNVPGSRNEKRYEDVQDILDAGIHVVTTLNVQHLESLYDTVESGVGVKVRERLPDSVLAEADQIVNVDLSTQDLRRRLEEGKIYPAERVQTALGNFFTGSNLEQLREIALREMASQIDLRRREPDDQGTAPMAEQVMVCLSSGGPNSEMLLRYASRLAGRLNRNWYALYVQTPSEEPTTIDAETQRDLAGTLTLAKQLGAMVFTYKGEDIPETILRFAKEYRVGHVVIGKPRTLTGWERILGRKSIAERLMAEADGITLVVLDTRQTPVRKSQFPEAPVRKSHATHSVPRIPRLTSLLSPEKVLIWSEPVVKQEVLSRLVKAALGNTSQTRLPEAIQKISDRESQGSTFFNEGVAFPHARLDDLDGPHVALGITRNGIVDVQAERAAKLVFLILTPLESPNTQLQILALASKAAQNRHLFQSLEAVDTPERAMTAIENWESMQQQEGGAGAPQ